MAGESPASVLYDADGNPVLIGADGVYQISVRDEEVVALLRSMLTELKRLTYLMQDAMDTEVSSSDVE